MTACSTTSAPEAALVKTTNVDVQDALTRAVSKVVGAPVTLAPDSFTAKSFVTIEPASVNKRNGAIIDGRTMERPSHVDLVMIGGKCFVIDRATGEKVPLEGVDCQRANS